VKRPLRLLLAAAILAALVVVAVRSLDAQSLWGAIRSATLGPVLLAALAAGALCLPAAARRGWRMVTAFPAEHPILYSHYFALHAATSTVNAWLAAPAGEVLRTLHLTRCGYPLVAAAASQAADRLIDALGLLVQIAIAALFLTLPAPLLGVANILAIAAPAAILAVLGALQLSERARTRLRPVLRPRILAEALAASLVNDAANIATVALCAYAVGAPISAGTAFTVVIAARLSGILPTTPGQAGVQEAGIVLALGLVGIGRERALAIALVYRVVHLVPVTLLGLASLRGIKTAKKVETA
jgi:uncharacterized membrane protein YbhN (UPF0104 family)